MSARQVRVLHLIDGLAGGGSERWLFDIVRLSDPRRVRHRIVTVHPDLNRFVYVARLRALGAYGRRADTASAGVKADGRGNAFRRVRSAADVTPGGLRNALRWTWHAVGVFPAAVHRCRTEMRDFQPEILHAHAFHGLALGLLTARLTGRPLIHTVPARFAQMRDAHYGWAETLYRKFHTNVAQFFTAYPLELKRIGVPDSRISVLQTVCDFEAVATVRAQKSEIRRAVLGHLGIPQDSLVLVSVGRLHHSKGHRFAADALGDLVSKGANVHWILVGEGTDRGEIERRLRERGVTDRARLVGFQEDPLPMYAAADLYLRTTILEADNISSLQAMAMGLPVIGFDTGIETDLLPEVGHGILVPEKDPERLAAAIRSLIDDAPRRARLGTLGVRYSESGRGGLREAVEAFSKTYERLTSPD